jgi:hypothetical protein
MTYDYLVEAGERARRYIHRNGGADPTPFIAAYFKEITGSDTVSDLPGGLLTVAQEMLLAERISAFLPKGEAINMRAILGARAQNERTLSPDTTTTAHMRPVDETPEPAQNNGKPREL